MLLLSSAPAPHPGPLDCYYTRNWKEESSQHVRLLPAVCPFSTLHLALILCMVIWGKITTRPKYIAYSRAGEPMHWHGMRWISIIQINDIRGRYFSVISSYVFSLPFSQLADSSGHMCVDAVFVGPDSCFQRLARITAGHCYNQTVPQWKNRAALVWIQRETLCHFFIRDACIFSWIENKNYQKPFVINISHLLLNSIQHSWKAVFLCQISWSLCVWGWQMEFVDGECT